MSTLYEKEMIRLADSIAEQAHAGQSDKIGRPYITHARRVAFLVRHSAPEHMRVEAQIVALLHDTVEDTGVSLEYLARYFSVSIVDAVDALTKREGETLDQSIARIRANELARIVKHADITDNTDPERTSLLDESTRRHLDEKYRTARTLLSLGE